MQDWREVAPGVWEIEPRGGMRVRGRVFATDRLIEGAIDDQAVMQVRNVAHLPGIVGASMAMPDIHWGYGFPIGGVAATDITAGGVVSPGGVGFDICCGVRLLRSDLTLADFRRSADRIMDALSAAIPRGAGPGGIGPPELLRPILERGVPAAIEAGFGTAADLDRCEERGTSDGADPGLMSELAMQRGARQIGSLGGGNHFLEVQVVDRIDDAAGATAMDLTEGMICVMIHCGSRGLGHQTCNDHLKRLGDAMLRHGIEVPDRQLACVPVHSAEGSGYLAAMASASNFAWVNRHVLADAARRAFARALRVPVEGVGMDLVYDVAHNLAKIEDHVVGGERRTLCVHRKGATRALAPGHPDLPPEYRAMGQPVLVPGSMGTASWVLRGVEGNRAFASAAHGAGRLLSRKAAMSRESGRAVRTRLESRGIRIRPGSTRLLAEEAPGAYKDVDAVAEACRVAGLAAPVVRMRPVGVVKG